MKTVATGFLLLTILGVTGSWLVSPNEPVSPPKDAARAALPVTTMVLEPVSSITRNRQFTGTVVAARRTRLAFERSARLLQVQFDEGQHVSEGATLAVIDQRQLAAEVTELQAGIEQQKAVLDELIKGPRAELIASARADLAAESADVELRKATYDRTQGLFDRRATSAQALDEVRLAWKAAVARRDAVSRKLDELVAGTRKEQITAQRAVVAALEAKLAQRQIDVEDSELKAPFSGTIVRRFADEGDMLSPQQPVLELLEADQLEARVGVPSSLIDSLDLEGYVVMTSGQSEVTGRIRNVVSQVDAATRTQTVVIDIDNPVESGLADGALIRLQFDETHAVEGYRVPLTALASGSRGLWSLYVLETDKRDPSHSIVAARAVEVLHTNGDTAVVRGAIYQHERIIVDGVHRVVPGQRVSDVNLATEKS